MFRKNFDRPYWIMTSYDVRVNADRNSKDYSWMGSLRLRRNFKQWQ